MPTVQVTAYVCSRCEHQWVPRSAQKPVICPKCKSPYWDRPVKRHTTSAAKKKGK
jgi:ribosomal protein L37AE/L43A